MTFGLMTSICWNRNGSHVVDFVRLRIAVLRRAALDDVRDVDVLAREVDRFDDLRQQLAGAADERDALHVLVGARRLADEHQVRVGIADAEHDLLAPERVQLAARAVADVGRGSQSSASAALLKTGIGDASAAASGIDAGAAGVCPIGVRHVGSRLTPATPSSAANRRCSVS